MKHTRMKHTSVKKIITHKFIEDSSKDDPFFLENLMYDLEFDIKKITELTIDLTIPKNLSVFIIDDLHFEHPITNTVNITLEENSIATYQFFVANHELCNLCDKKEFFDCQQLPTTFTKTLVTKLTQSGAQAYINCHYLGDQESSFTIHTTQHHLASNTTSKLRVKSVLDNRAKLISDNIIIVEKNLQKITAEQTNKNLLLTDTAHVVSIPKLRVLSQQVSCKHGATVSKINENDLLYLQSRGIEKPDAERMLIEAFLR